MTRSELVLVRHGETSWSRTGRHTGRTDIPLTDHGREQADSLGDALRGREFAAAFVSPLGRAAETAHRALPNPGLIDLLEGLVEWDYGVYEGRTTNDIRQTSPHWTVWDSPVPSGESPEDVGRRADTVIERAVAQSGDVAIVAHGHLLRVLAARWIGLEPTAGRHLALATATTSVLGYERETRVIHRWNEQCHLDALP